MKLDTEEEWSKMASTGAGFVAAMVFCKYLDPSPSWFVIGAMIFVWFGSAIRATHCKFRDLRSENDSTDGV